MYSYWSADYAEVWGTTNTEPIDELTLVESALMLLGGMTLIFAFGFLLWFTKKTWRKEPVENDEDTLANEEDADETHEEDHSD
jgi:hypothetical protein